VVFSVLVRTFLGVCLLAASAALVWQVFLSAPEQAADSVLAAHPPPPYQPRDWSLGKPQPLHISVYTFRDINRSGRYDVGDLPMASVVVDLTSPGGQLTRAQSNINGYANFNMALGHPNAPINEPGRDYRFTVLPPPGWRISSGNATQAIEFTALPGSIAGLVARPAPQWVGLEPDLTIRGRLVAAVGDVLPTDLQLTLLAPGGAEAAIAPGDGGEFVAPVEPGRWQLRLSSPSLAWQLDRVIDVRATPVALLDIAVGGNGLQRQPLPVPIVENFDWLQRSVIDKIPNGQEGLDWDYLLAVDNQEYGGPGYLNGLVSGHAVAYNSSGHPVTVSAPAGGQFDFVGGYFSAAWSAAEGETLAVTAWRDGREVARGELHLSSFGPVWLDADLCGIDRLTLSTRHYSQFVADDLAFRLAR